VNFEHDMISLGDNNLPALKAHGSQIQRLSFTVADEGAYDHFYYFGKRDLEGFPRLQEIRVVVEAGMLFWPSAFADCDWGGCPRDRIHFLDVSSGLLLTGEQLNAVDDWRIYCSWDGAGAVREGELDDEEFGHGESEVYAYLSGLRRVD
jgi:hypothetical protein